MDIEGIDIKWLGHSSFKINEGIFIDPFSITSEGGAKLILITHGHYDHCSIQDVANVANNETVIISVPDCQSKLAPIMDKIKDFKLIRPWESITIEGVKITAVPAYNTKKQFHPKVNEWVGFVLELNGKKIYHSGDSDLIDEMHRVNADIAMLCIDGKYTMSGKEAAEAAKRVKARYAIPMHYGHGFGNSKELEDFKNNLGNIKFISTR